MPPIVTLTTDFGIADPYVAAVKGVLLARVPDVVLVDVSHEVPPHDVLVGAFVLDGAASWFPRGTLHLAVVDPGVGTARDLLVVEAGGFTFLAPDNGLLSLVLGRWPDARSSAVVDAAPFRLPRVSTTFHGRDLLAPLAAALLTDRLRPADALRATTPMVLPDLDARVTHHRVQGRVMFPDRFGNLVTNVTRSDVTRAFGAAPFRARLAGRDLGPVVETYAAGAGRGPFPIWGSTERLEVSVSGASAAAQVPGARGIPIELTD